MSIKSAAALIAALVITASSAALADNSQFDVNIYRPTVQDSGHGAFARQLPGQLRVAPANDPFRAHAEERVRGFGTGGCIPQYDSAGVQKAPYCHH